MRIAALVVVGLIAACATNAEEATPPPPRAPQVPLQPQTFRLSNGMKVILVPDSSADIASVLVRYHVGSIDETPGQEGVAHVAAHLSYAQRTGTLTLWDQLDRVGTWINTTPDVEHTDFTLQFEPQQLAEVLKLEAQRLARRCDGVSETWFDWLNVQVREELRANDTRLTNRTVSHALYPSSDPYRRAYDATPDSVERITREQTCAFMDRHFSPANSVIVVSGPFEPGSFERTIQQDLGRVPAPAVGVRPRRASLPATGFQTRLTTDVAEPTLVIAWPLPTDEGGRAVMLFAADLLVQALKASLFVEDNYVVVWMTENDSGIESAVERVRTTLRAGLIAPKEFERTRSRHVTARLGILDAIPSRLEEVERTTDLDARFKALAQVSVQGFDAIVAANFEWSRARVIELQPDGSRPRRRPASLADPRHALRGPSSFPGFTSPSLSASASNVLSRARSFQLANGLTVVLVPSSPVPLVDIRLAFRAGAASEPPTHRGTASVAIAALQEVANRGPDSVDSSWAVGMAYAGAGMDSTGIGVRGATMHLDLLMNQFEGLAESQFQQADVQKGYDALVKVAASPLRQQWNEEAAVRSTVYGADHPYGQVRVPSSADAKNFDAREVETFYRRYLQPNNATLVVTGGFDPDVVTKLVHQVFDRWKGKGESVSTQLPQGKTATYAAADQSSTVMLRIEWKGGTLDEHYEARTVLANMLNAMSGRVNARYTARRQGGTYLLVGKFDPATAAEEIGEIVERIPLVGSEASRYKAAFASALRRGTRAQIGGARSSGQWSSMILFAIENGRDVKWLAGMAQRFAKVTHEEVMQLAKTELTTERATWFVSGPRDAVAAVYKELGVEPTWMTR